MGLETQNATEWGTPDCVGRTAIDYEERPSLSHFMTTKVLSAFSMARISLLFSGVALSAINRLVIACCTSLIRCSNRELSVSDMAAL
jgi:hypothetical protein